MTTTTTRTAAAAAPIPSIALDYAQRMFNRQHEPLEPLGFDVDWADRPSRHKIYPGATKLVLPRPFVGHARGSVHEAFATARGGASVSGEASADGAPSGMPDLGLIASALACAAITDRHVGLNWNDDAHRKQRPIFADWSRVTPSGGGMYPTETYLVVGQGGPVPVGVYHYDTAHHALDLLTPTDRSALMESATGVSAPCHLVGAARLWKNAFKYNSFCYHVVTHDTGALLGSWRAVFGSAGLSIVPRLWFDQSGVAEAIGVDGREEPPVIVVPLGVGEEVRDGGGLRGGPTLGGSTTIADPLSPSWELSARPRTFPMVDRVNAATWVSSSGVAPGSVTRAGALDPLGPGHLVGPPVPLPTPPWQGLGSLPDSLARRHSAFGTLSSRPAVQLEQLAAILETVDLASTAPTDLAGDGRQPWLRTWVIAAHVDGVPPGGYAYEPSDRALLPVRHGILEDLQKRYPLQNYNAAEVAATIVLTGRLASLIGELGDPAYRFLSIESGQAAQAVYLAATAAGLGVGAVFGVDNITINEWLRLEGDEVSTLCLFVGSERPAAGYDHRLVHRNPGLDPPRTTTMEDPA